MSATHAELEARAAALEAAGGPRIRCADPEALERFAELLQQAEQALGLSVEAAPDPVEAEDEAGCAV